MSDIAARAPLVYIDACRRAGLDLSALLDGLPFTEVSLRERPSTPVGWDGFAALLDRMAELVGGLEALERHPVTELYRDAYELTALAAAFISPRVFVTFCWERVSPQYLGNIEASSAALDERLVQLTMRLRPSMRDCAAFFHSHIGALETLPFHLGLPRARVVEAQVGPREGRYLVELPPSATLLARARQTAAGQLASSLLRIVHADEPPLRAAYDEQRRRVAELEAQARRLSTVLELGRRLSACRGLGALGDELGAIFVGQLGFGLVELWLAPLDGERFEPVRRGEGEADGAECFPLEAAGQAVGELRLSGPPSVRSAGAGRELLGQLLPWVATSALHARALEAAQRQGAPPVEAEADPVRPPLDAFSARWGLTDRQTDLLGRVLRGESTAEMAASLGVSESAVEQQLTQLFRKAGVGSRAALLARCLGPA